MNPAIIFPAANRVEVKDLPMPPPRRGEVQVRSTRSTISAGTEGWCLRDGFGWTPVPFPVVPGYQRSGIITALGEGVASDWRVGQRVFAVGSDWEDGSVNAFWGGHILTANVTEPRLFRIPENMTDSTAACLVVAQVGYNAASRLRVSSGDWILVYGDGLIGQFGAQAARARGARVILVGHRDERLKLGAASKSADVILNPKSVSDFGAAVKERTGGAPIRAVIDTIQTDSAQRQYLPLFEPSTGQVVFSGHNPDPSWANLALLQQRELAADFVAGWTRDRMQSTIDLMVNGKMNVEPLVTHRVSFIQAPAMFDMIVQKSGAFLGIEFTWD